MKNSGRNRPNLIVCLPSGFTAERTWVVSELMGQLDCAYEIRMEERADWQIRVADQSDCARADEQAVLEMPDAFFRQAEASVFAAAAAAGVATR